MTKPLDSLDLLALCTPLAAVVRRVHAVGLAPTGDAFLCLSYLSEAAIKLVAVSFYAALKPEAPTHATRVGFNLVSADGIGTWDAIIRDCTAGSLVEMVPGEFYSLRTWGARRRTTADDEWCRDAIRAGNAVLEVLGLDGIDTGAKPTVRDLVTVLVRIRNKTKAHGAVGPDFFEKANSRYADAIGLFLANLPVAWWDWYYLGVRVGGSRRAVRLRGLLPTALGDAEKAALPMPEDAVPGVYVLPPGANRAFLASPLITTNPECSSFLFPNGEHQLGKEAACIDYGSGDQPKLAFPEFAVAPAPLPASETEGLRILDVQSNVFGNLPRAHDGYVHRPELERSLETRLRDRNHPIITLHGRGGVGKTSLALEVAHRLAAENAPPFEQIVWFSARDVDLLPRGPAAVRRAVASLDAVAREYGRLFQPSMHSFNTDDLAVALAGVGAGSPGTLFIFDNFETTDDPLFLHQFLDTHTHLPNKVLLTSRERSFVADFPIEVSGMEFKEAQQLIVGAARELSIEPLVTLDVQKKIFDETEGHAYMMRVIVGELAKEGRYVSARTLIAQRADIVDSIFQRSFKKLSDDGRWVFLLVSGWRVRIPELSLLVSLGPNGIDVLAGIEECLRMSLIAREALVDGQYVYWCPHLASVFGQKKMQGDPDKLQIGEALAVVRQIGPATGTGANVVAALVDRFIDSCVRRRIDTSSGEVERIDNLLEAIAEIDGRYWLAVARFRKEAGRANEAIQEAYRRAVEAQPASKVAWLARAEFARSVGDELTEVTSLTYAVDADPTDVVLVRDVAYRLCGYINRHTGELSPARRGVFLATVRAHMERVSDRLDATGLSRLAWLYLLEATSSQDDASERARRWVERGLVKDPNNEHCLRLWDRLHSRR